MTRSWRKALFVWPLVGLLFACTSNKGGGDGAEGGAGASGGDGGGGGEGGDSGGGGEGGEGGGASGGNGGGGRPAASGGAAGQGDAGVDPMAPDANVPAFRTCIMPVGDSITQADIGHVSYRYWLWKTLKDDGYKAGFVGSRKQRHVSQQGQMAVGFPDAMFDMDHEGYWGKKPSEIHQLMQDAGSWDKRMPGIVLLHAGTNEVWNVNSESADAVAQRTAMGLKSLITLLRSKNPNAVILIAKIIPLSTQKFFGAFQDAIVKINESVVQLAAAENTAASPVQVVDQHTGFTDDMFLGDGIHPNEAGEKQLAAKWFAALKPLLAGLKDVPCAH